MSRNRLSVIARNGSRLKTRNESNATARRIRTVRKMRMNLLGRIGTKMTKPHRRKDVGLGMMILMMTIVNTTVPHADEIDK